MKHSSVRKLEAFTRLELVVVIVGALIVVTIPFLMPHHGYVSGNRISCINNFKQIGMAYRIWASDNHDLFPAQADVAVGGWSNYLGKSDQGFVCWTNYAIMKDELGLSTKLLICPSDMRQPATSFNTLSNTNISYLVGVSANDAFPQSLLAADRNLCTRTNRVDAYGFSPSDGKGNDVALLTNSQIAPLRWTLKMHSGGASIGAGNILLGDGSAQEVTSGNLSGTWQPNFDPTTNWPSGHTPSTPSIRVLFP